MAAGGATTGERRAVSVLVLGAGGAELLAVRRPDDDEELPGLWGLPAVSLRPGEAWEDAARRAGREKLGVELTGLRSLEEGTVERPGGRLRMRLFGARIAAGRPDVARPRATDDAATRYVAWGWSPPERLEEAARRGSLCSRLCLRHLGRG